MHVCVCVCVCVFIENLPNSIRKAKIWMVQTQGHPHKEEISVARDDKKNDIGLV